MEQAMACLTCRLAGYVPDHLVPLQPGLWDHPCPACGEHTVWITPPAESIEAIVRQPPL